MTTQDLQHKVNQKVFKNLDDLRRIVEDPKYLNQDCVEYKELINCLNENLRIAFEVKNLLEDHK